MPTVKELTLGDCIELRNGLGQLDGFTKIVSDKPVFVPYKFKDSTRRKIVANLRVLKPIVEDGDEIRLRIIKDIASEETPGVIDEFDAVRNTEANNRWRKERKESKHTVSLEMFDRSELFVEDKNPIPGSVEVALTAVLNDVTDVETKKAEGGDE